MQKEVNGHTFSATHEHDLIIIRLDDQEMYVEWEYTFNDRVANKIFNYLETRCLDDPENFSATLMLVHLIQ